MRPRVTMITMTALLLGLSLSSRAATNDTQTDAAIAAKLGREVRATAFYTIWDDVKLAVQDGRVTLSGKVSFPGEKAELTQLARRVPGVTAVNDQLGVLSTSAFDAQLRRQVAGAIYGDAQLARYGQDPHPSIHVIVDHGHVTLEGVVANALDKTMAGLRAGENLSFGALTNNLVVVPEARRS